MSEGLHPFWKGVFSELEKGAGMELVGPAAKVPQTSRVTASSMGLSGIGGLVTERKLLLRKFKKGKVKSNIKSSLKSGTKGVGLKGLVAAGIGTPGSAR